MSEFKIIDYSNWSSDLRKLAQKVDNNDDTKGLSNSKEVIEFFNSAYENGYDKKSINELFGLEITANSAVKRRAAANNTEFSQYADYFNSLDYIDRSNLIYSANNIGYEKLAELEKDINTAFEECKGYGLIKTRRDRFEDRTRFDIQEVHNDVQTALESINELQAKLEKAYDKAKGQTGSAPQYADYETRLKNIAFSTLGESYEDFIAHNNLDFTKTITEAEAYDPKYKNSIVYGKATDVKAAGYAYGSGKMAMSFDEILTPDGDRIKLTSNKVFIEVIYHICDSRDRRVRNVPLCCVRVLVAMDHAIKVENNGLLFRFVIVDLVQRNKPLRVDTRFAFVHAASIFFLTCLARPISGVLRTRIA